MDTNSRTLRIEQILPPAATLEGSTHAGVPVTILVLHGALDASNYEEMIVRADQLYREGTRRILVDMSDLNYMSSSGLVALHHMVLTLAGRSAPDPDSGWDAYRAIDKDRQAGLQPYVKLLKPQPIVARSLHITGMDTFFEIHTDLGTALASFTS